MLDVFLVQPEVWVERAPEVHLPVLRQFLDCDLNLVRDHAGPDVRLLLVVPRIVLHDEHARTLDMILDLESLELVHLDVLGQLREVSIQDLCLLNESLALLQVRLLGIVDLLEHDIYDVFALAAYVSERRVELEGSVHVGPAACATIHVRVVDLAAE